MLKEKEEMTHALPSLPHLASRLAWASDFVGSKRKLAAVMGVSEAQLFRYLKGESEPSASALQAVAETTETSISWLLSGAALRRVKGQEKPYDGALMQELLQCFHEVAPSHSPTIATSDYPILIHALYQAFRHEKEILGSLDVSKLMIRNALIFLYHAGNASYAENTLKAMDTLVRQQINREDLDSAFWTMYAGQIQSACNYYFESSAAQEFHDRLGLYVPHETREIMHQLVMRTTQNQPAEWLEIGCGNGRELAYLHETYPHLKLYGVDNSSLSESYLSQLESARKLPKETFHKAPATGLPFDSGSMNVVYSRQLLFRLVDSPYNEHGVRRFIKEVSRVLKHNGFAILMSVAGDKELFLPYMRQISDDRLTQLTNENGLYLEKIYYNNLNARLENNKREFPTKYGNNHVWVLSKK